MYDLRTKKLSEFKVPGECWVSDWSPDGKRLLTDVRPNDGTVRVAWINADGGGNVDFVTGEDEVAYRGWLVTGWPSYLVYGRGQGPER